MSSELIVFIVTSGLVLLSLAYFAGVWAAAEKSEGVHGFMFLIGVVAALVLIVFLIGSFIEVQTGAGT